VPRARLVNRLLEAHDVPLALLVAPAGYGKTTVLTEWAEHDPRPFAWVRLDDRHNDPQALAELATRATGRRQPLVLVLDDVHVLHTAEAYAILGEIAAGMPPGSQLALASRREPELPVGSLRAHRRVVELRAADLAMGRTEAATLLESAGLRLRGRDLDTVLERTEGWPAGLYLAALSIRAQPDVAAAVSRFAGDDCLVADYIRDELLAALTPARADFLIRTSVLDTLSGSLCDTVLESSGSARALADLARSNALLVCLDRTGESYRCHRLFREMLRGELRRGAPELEPELHRRAAAWHASCGEAHSAIRHAVAGGDVEAAGKLLWAHATDHIAHGDNERVRLWLDEFTTEQCAASPRLALVAAASWLAAGDRGQVERWTGEAARCLALAPDAADASMRAALAVLRAAVAADGVARMGADAVGAARSEPDRSHWRSLANLLEGVSLHVTGRGEDARARLAKGGGGGAAAAPNIQVLCLAQHALLVMEREDWDGAAVLTARARSQIKACGLESYPTLALAFAVSGLVRAQRGIVEDARDDLQRSLRLLGRLADFAPWYGAETRITLARAALRLGDVTAARTLLAEATQLMQSTPDATTLRAWLEDTRSQLEAATLSAGETCALTTAELRVLRLLPTHLSFPAIASRLYVSPNTVKTHARAVYRKLDASSRSEAVAHALAAGLLDEAQAA
jgi:LuxR family transcriptional regulator, maltose regulon positive regulatory protein